MANNIGSYDWRASRYDAAHQAVRKLMDELPVQNGRVQRGTTAQAEALRKAIQYRQRVSYSAENNSTPRDDRDFRDRYGCF